MSPKGELTMIEYNKFFKMPNSIRSTDAVNTYLNKNPQFNDFHKAHVLYHDTDIDKDVTIVMYMKLKTIDNIGYISLAGDDESDETRDNYTAFLQSGYLNEYNTEDDDISLYLDILVINSQNRFGRKLSLNIALLNN